MSAKNNRLHLTLILSAALSSGLRADNSLSGLALDMGLGIAGLVFFLTIVTAGFYTLLLFLKPVIGRRKKTRRKDLWTVIATTLVVPAVLFFIMAQFEKIGFAYTVNQQSSKVLLLIFAVCGAAIGYWILPKKETDSDDEVDQKKESELLIEKLKLKVGLHRKHFFGFQLLFIFLFYLLRSLGSLELINNYFGSTITLLLLAAFIFEFIITLRRLYDCNLNAYFSLLLILPYVNIAFIIFLCIRPGEPEENEHGNDPKETDSLQGETSENS